MRVVLAFTALILLSAADAFAGIRPIQIIPVPTLNQWGLIAMAGILGIVGFMIIRRRKVTAKGLDSQ